MADSALDIFSTISRDSSGLSQIKKSPPAEKGSNKKEDKEIKKDLFLKIQSLGYFRPLLESGPAFFGEITNRFTDFGRTEPGWLRPGR